MEPKLKMSRKIHDLIFSSCQRLIQNLTYLELPLRGNPKASSFLNLVLDGISYQLDAWKKAFLFLGGRITLI